MSLQEVLRSIFCPQHFLVKVKQIGASPATPDIWHRYRYPAKSISGASLMFLMLSVLSVQRLLSACFSCKLHKCYFSVSLRDDMNIRNTFLIFQQAIAERKPVQKPVAFTVEVPRPGRVERRPAPTNSNNSSSQSTNSSSSSRLTLTNSSSSSRLTNSGSSSRLAKQPCQVS